MKQPYLSLKNNANCCLATFGSALLLVSLFAAAPLPTCAAPGDLVANVTLPVDGNGVSVAVDCNGVIYFTTGPIGADVPALATLHKTDRSGANLGSVPIVDGGGSPVQIDEMAWDDGRKVVWGLQHNSHPLRVWRVEPTTGLATFAFTSASDTPTALYSDGISYEANDDTLWITADVSDTVEHYQACDGTLIGSITPKDASGNTLGRISGVQVGVGNLLYVGRDGEVQIVQVRKSDGGFLGVFANPAGVRDEGLECDAVSFAPRLVIWSRDFEQSRIVAIEVEPGTCACQALCPENIVVCNDPGECGAIVSYQTEAANTVCVPPSGSVFPVGQTVVTCTRTHPCPDVQPQTCTFTVTVNDCEPPRIKCPDNIVVCNDPGLCSAVVNYVVTASDNCPGLVLVCAPLSGSVFPVGDTVVNCTATDAVGHVSKCSFIVRVKDCEAPVAECIPTVNPAGGTVPPAGPTPNPQGQNEEGYYELQAKDNCDGVNLSIFVKDSAEGPCGGVFAAGPYAPGTKVKLTQSSGQASVKPMAGVIVAHINTTGDPVLVVTDNAGNQTCHVCLVPRPPK